MKPESLLIFLRDHQQIDQEQMTELLDEQVRTGKPIEDVVANSGTAKMSEVYEMIAHTLGTEVVDVSKMEFPAELLSLIPPHTARVQGVLPVDFDGQVLRVVVTDPLDPNVADNLRFATQRDVAIYVAPPAAIQTLIERYYGVEVSDMDVVLTELSGEAESKDGNNDVIDIETASSAPIIKYVNTVLAQAIQARASDIHFEPFETEFKIRYRVDGAPLRDVAAAAFPGHGDHLAHQGDVQLEHRGAARATGRPHPDDDGGAAG